MIIAHHVPVQVDTVPACCGPMMDRVDKIGSAFEGLYPDAFPTQGPQQTQGHGGLTGATVWGCNKELGFYCPDFRQIYYVCNP